MFVQVRLFATFREGRFKEKQIDLLEGATLADLLTLLRIEQENARILLLNGIAASPETTLTANDIIAIFPPIAGG